MKKAPTKPRLELKSILSALDNQKLEFWNSLDDDEKKLYSPFILMRYMSSLPNHNPLQEYAILAVNDLVNIGFSELTKHPELQHKLLCISGTGGMQYHPWISPASGKRKTGNVINDFFSELYPESNTMELEILKSSYDSIELYKLAIDAGLLEKDALSLKEFAEKQ